MKRIYAITRQRTLNTFRSPSRSRSTETVAHSTERWGQSISEAPTAISIIIMAILQNFPSGPIIPDQTKTSIKKAHSVAHKSSNSHAKEAQLSKPSRSCRPHCAWTWSDTRGAFSAIDVSTPLTSPPSVSHVVWCGFSHYAGEWTPCHVLPALPHGGVTSQPARAVDVGRNAWDPLPGELGEHALRGGRLEP